jgi:hypothetical protein
MRPNRQALIRAPKHPLRIPGAFLDAARSMAGGHRSHSKYSPSRDSGGGHVNFARPANRSALMYRALAEEPASRLREADLRERRAESATISRDLRPFIPADPWIWEERSCEKPPDFSRYKISGEEKAGKRRLSFRVFERKRLKSRGFLRLCVRANPTSRVSLSLYTCRKEIAAIEKRAKQAVCPCTKRKIDLLD